MRVRKLCEICTTNQARRAGLCQSCTSVIGHLTQPGVARNMIAYRAKTGRAPAPGLAAFAHE